MGYSFEIVQQANVLAAQGRGAEALALVQRSIADGNPFADFTLGDWALRGVVVPQDTARARALFKRASDAGMPTARKFYTNLLVGGVGGPADWPQALERLRAEAATDKTRAAALQLVEAMQLDPHGRPTTLPAEEALCDAPEIRLFRGLFTPTECAYLNMVAEPGFLPSVVTSDGGARDHVDSARTSEGSTMNWLLVDPAIQALNVRVATASGTTVEQGEPLQVLRYAVGQQFRPHSDWIEGAPNQRIKTALVYLNSGYEGGETRFINAGIDVKGAVGDAIIFRNAADDGTPDPLSLHAGLPVTAGVKLIASRWIRVRPFDETNDRQAH
ncbi:prolyl 4-hydroxylase [Sphingomonas sp. F9_3S_D5_B_2]